VGRRREDHGPDAPDRLRRAVRGRIREEPARRAGIGWIIAGGILVVALLSRRRRRLLARSRAAARGARAADSRRACISWRRSSSAATHGRARARGLDRASRRQSRRAARDRARGHHREVARAAASRAKVDTTGLRPDVLEALADADALRIAVAAYLPRDSATIAVYQTAGAEYSHTIELHVGAYAEQGAALIARESEIRALQQQHAPRCGWKCGAVIGATATAVVFGGLTYLLVAATAP
jgi:hypothetical protein